MLDIATIRLNIATVTEQFSSEMMQEALKGNVEYFRNTLDQLTEDEYDDLYFNFDREYYFNTVVKNKNSISEIILTLICYAIDNFDDDILNYVLNENKVFLANKHRFTYNFKILILQCIEKSRFDIAKLLIESLQCNICNLSFLDFYEEFILYLKSEYLTKMQFIIDNFEIKTEFIFSFILTAMLNGKIFSFRFLLREYKKRNDVDSAKDRLISYINEFPEIDGNLKILFVNKIDEIWDLIIESSESI